MCQRHQMRWCLAQTPCCSYHGYVSLLSRGHFTGATVGWAQLGRVLGQWTGDNWQTWMGQARLGCILGLSGRVSLGQARPIFRPDHQYKFTDDKSVCVIFENNHRQ